MRVGEDTLERHRNLCRILPLALVHSDCDMVLYYPPYITFTPAPSPPALYKSSECDFLDGAVGCADGGRTDRWGVFRE